MTLLDVIVSVLSRLGHGEHQSLISFDEVQHWPAQAFTLLLQEKLIKPGNPAKTILCSGCPENCFKPVCTLSGKNGKLTRHFIACDETDYMGKIPVRSEQLQQWRITAKQVAAWIAKQLKLRSNKSIKGSNEISVGLMLTDQYRCQITLDTNDALSLNINQEIIPLIDVIMIEDDQLFIDQLAIEALANQKLASNKKTEYQPSTTRREARKLETQKLYAEWQKMYRQMKRQHPNKSDTWISIQIAKKEIAQNRNSETIRKNMKG